MAVQPQYPSIAAFRVNNNNNYVLENFHQDHHHHLQNGHHHQHQHQHQVLIKNGTVFSDPAQSELTCNFVVSASTTTTRKRKNTTTSTSNSTRVGVEGDDQMPPHHQYQYLNPQHQHQEINVHNYNNYFPYSRITKLPKLDQLISSVDVNKSFEENRLNPSSTSGRRRTPRYHDDDNDEDAVLLSTISLPQQQQQQQQHSQHLNSSSYYYFLPQNQNLDDEIDALIRLQHETLRSVVEQKQCRLLLASSVLEQQVQGIRLKEKQIELENALGRNAELEEKIKQLSSENQMWFNVANNNEAMVLSLRSTLEHQLLNLHHHHHHHHHQNQNNMGLVVEEGFGDSSDGVGDDAQSSNNNNNCHQQQQVNVGEREYKTVNNSNVDVRDDDASMMMKEQQQQQQQQQQQHRKMCKVCKEMEVSVLLLPCRHLCLCKDCEAKLQACPICNSFKNASLQIFMS